MVSTAQRGQVSIEYILIVAFTFAILIPGVYFFYTYSQNSAASLASAQFDKLGQEMLSTAVQMLAQGQGSWVIFDANIPSEVDDISIASSGSELVIRYHTSFGSSDAVFFSDVKLSANSAQTQQDASIFNGGAHGGLSRFKFEAGPNGIVGISDTFNMGSTGCTPSKTCADYPGQCGSGFSDGCTNSLTCACTLPDTCGGGGTPGLCGHSDCTAYFTGPSGGMCNGVTSLNYTATWSPGSGVYNGSDFAVIRVGTNLSNVQLGCSGPYAQGCVVAADIPLGLGSYFVPDLVPALQPGTLYWNRVAHVCWNPNSSYSLKEFVWNCTAGGCSQDSDCNDSNECTGDRCVGNVCLFSNRTAGWPCTTGTCDGSGNCCTPNWTAWSQCTNLSCTPTCAAGCAGTQTRTDQNTCPGSTPTQQSCIIPQTNCIPPDVCFTGACCTPITTCTGALGAPCGMTDTCGGTCSHYYAGGCSGTNVCNTNVSSILGRCDAGVKCTAGQSCSSFADCNGGTCASNGKCLCAYTGGFCSKSNDCGPGGVCWGSCQQRTCIWVSSFTPSPFNCTTDPTACTTGTCAPGGKCICSCNPTAFCNVDNDCGPKGACDTNPHDLHFGKCLCAP